MKKTRTGVDKVKPKVWFKFSLLVAVLHHYQNAADIQNRQIQCKKDQMQVSHEKNMVEVEQSSTVTNSQSIRT